MRQAKDLCSWALSAVDEPMAHPGGPTLSACGAGTNSSRRRVAANTDRSHKRSNTHSSHSPHHKHEDDRSERRVQTATVWRRRCRPKLTSLEALLRTALDSKQSQNLEQVHDGQTRSILVVDWTHHWSWLERVTEQFLKEHEAVHARQTKAKDMSQQERCRLPCWPSRAVCVLRPRLRVRCVM